MAPGRSPAWIFLLLFFFILFYFIFLGSGISAQYPHSNWVCSWVIDLSQGSFFFIIYFQWHYDNGLPPLRGNGVQHSRKWASQKSLIVAFSTSYVQHFEALLSGQRAKHRAPNWTIHNLSSPGSLPLAPRRQLLPRDVHWHWGSCLGSVARNGVTNLIFRGC